MSDAQSQSGRLLAECAVVRGLVRSLSICHRRPVGTACEIANTKPNTCRLYCVVNPGRVRLRFRSGSRARCTASKHGRRPAKRTAKGAQRLVKGSQGDCLAVSAPACSSSGAIPTIAVAGRRASSPSPVDHGIRLRLLARGPHRRTNGARTRAVGSLLPCVPVCPRLQCLNPGRPSCVRVRTASKFPPVRSIRPSFGHPPPSPPNNVAPAFATPASSARSVSAAATSSTAAVPSSAAQCGRRSWTAVAVALRDVPALCLRTTLSSPRTASISLRLLPAAAEATAVPPHSGPTGAAARRTPDPHALPLEDARLAGTSRPRRRRPRA